MGRIIEGLECLFNLPIVLFSFFPIGQQPWVELFPFPSSEEPIQILGLNLKKKKKKSPNESLTSQRPADGYLAGEELICLMDEQFTPREDINYERTRKSKEPSSESIRTLKYYFINLNILTILKTCSDRNIQGKEGRRENMVKDREKEKQKKREGGSWERGERSD